VQRESWGHTGRDVERCWNLEPDGCFIAESKNKPIGHIFSVLFGEVGWIGLLIVNPEKRGMGAGAALMEAAINYLENRGARTIKLEAVENAAPLYRRLGFIDAFDSLRLRGMPEQNENQSRMDETVSMMHENDVPEIAEFDAQYFGANRLSVLKSLHSDFPKYCFAAKENQRVKGYIMARKTLDEFWIGPWICVDSKIAEFLFSTLSESMRKESRYLRLGLPVLNTDARKLVEELGFQFVGKSIHMIRGERKNQGDVTRIYGIGGPEKG
jgi:ribosomal protein S18 acetylase RimI-like enzyme